MSLVAVVIGFIGLVFGGCHPASPLSVSSSTGAPELLVTPTGVGPITASTRATVAALRSLFPQARVRASSLDSELHTLTTVEVGDPVKLIVIQLGDPRLIYGEPGDHRADDIVSIRVLDPRATTRLGVGNGTRFETLRRVLGAPTCHAWDLERTGEASCESEELPHIRFDLQLRPGSAAADRDLEPAELDDALGGMTVFRMTWFP